MYRGTEDERKLLRPVMHLERERNRPPRDFRGHAQALALVAGFSTTALLLIALPNTMFWEIIGASPIALTGYYLWYSDRKDV